MDASAIQVDPTVTGELERKAPLPRLEQGDHLTRGEFERRYGVMPGPKKAELIEGVVVIPSPVRQKSHAAPASILNGWLFVYWSTTPGVEAGDNATVRLDPDNEPQPDAFLRILPEKGGQSKTSPDDYVEGAPELIAEIAASSASYDLFEKLNVYRRNGVLEYIVWRVLDGAVDWFRLVDEKYVRQEPDESGLIRSAIFPGLWLDTRALLASDLAKVLSTLQEGLASEEHQRFAAVLKER
jgi:Uma2 family endonuclease